MGVLHNVARTYGLKIKSNILPPHVSRFTELVVIYTLPLSTDSSSCNIVLDSGTISGSHYGQWFLFSCSSICFSRSPTWSATTETTTSVLHIAHIITKMTHNIRAVFIAMAVLTVVLYTGMIKQQAILRHVLHMSLFNLS